MATAEPVSALAITNVLEKTFTCLYGLYSSYVTHAGAVIANDVDLKRAVTLTHQIQKLASPSVAVSCLDGASFQYTAAAAAAVAAIAAAAVCAGCPWADTICRRRRFFHSVSFFVCFYAAAAFFPTLNKYATDGTKVAYFNP